MELGAETADGLFFVGTEEEVVAAKRTVLTLQGRDILLIHHQGEFYAIDGYCYHAGTSLQNGDIEALFTVTSVRFFPEEGYFRPHYFPMDCVGDCFLNLADFDFLAVDIKEQDIDSRLCIVCPKHKYKISLSAGEGLYRGRERGQAPSPGPAPLRWFSKGVKQRVHPLTVRQGALFLRLSSAGWVESDYYQGERGKVERERAAAALKDDDDGGEEEEEK